MLPLQLRGKVVSAAILLNRIGSGTVAFTFLSMQEAFSPEANANETALMLECDGDAPTGGGAGTDLFGPLSSCGGGDGGGGGWVDAQRARVRREGVIPLARNGIGGPTPAQVGTARTFYLYAALGFVITLFYIRFLPNLAGESLEDTGAAVATREGRAGQGGGKKRKNVDGNQYASLRTTPTNASILDTDA